MVARLVLVIEHEACIREVLEACLRDLGGWIIVLASSIKEGINLCEQQRPDVILIDTSTPEIDALLFIEELKFYSTKYFVPILLISSRANWLSAERLRQMGFAGVINKPFNPLTLSQHISQTLGWSA
ncbi:response regulator [Nodosilinea sp. LEGE 07298]|jgi:CheY-like chemotaxis protein|uniref:response regulator n=1 Tax=Nodosilinea sp. LEGE 07298 TaxID=2777970 RepID=UPI001881581F|nr:response regulator [Nodosilinea sp. LEGE 07298]MBE9110016.1 response regulator [Nodosilinea sp. LEGE 07298]